MSHLATVSGQDIRQPSGPAAPAASGSARSASKSTGSVAFPTLLTDEQAAASLGVSVRKFHDLREEAWMPRPVVLGPRLLRWPRVEIEGAVARMPRQEAKAPEPAQLRRAKIEKMKAGASA